MKNQELIEAIQKSDAARVAALLDEDRSLLKAKAGNVSAILLAIYHGHPEMATLFVDRGAEPSFGEAVALGDADRVHRMLESNPALLHSYTEDGYPAAGLAIFFRHPALARELIERGADVNAAARNEQRVAPLHAAAAVGDHDTIKLLLARGADPNARQQQGFTPLHSAASHGDVPMASMLIEHGADPKSRTDDGKDAAAIAEQFKQPAFAEWFRSRY